MNSLDNLIQNRLRGLQNPSNCSEAKKLVCNFKVKLCGYGCQLHHAVYCLILAYATQRMLVIKSDKGNEVFFDQESFKHIFQPLSLSCENLTDMANQKMVAWDSKDIKKELNVILHINPHNAIAGKRPRSRFSPCAIPKEIFKDLIKFHKHPCAWWVGQFVKYLLRPNSNFTSRLNALFKDIFKHRPIVGVHIRRTDKARTHKIYPVSSYMSQVDRLLSGKSKQQIYLASDDPKVFNVTRDQHPDVIVFGEEGLSRNAKRRKRKSPNAQCDFIVCTFTSNVCRLIYELRQCEDYNAANKTVSLDRKWSFFKGLTPLHSTSKFPTYA